MAKLKLGPISDEKPVRITAELPAAVHRDLLAYAEAFIQETGQSVEAAQLIGPMLARFMATDREFAKVRKELAARQIKARTAAQAVRLLPDAEPKSESA